MYGVDQGFDPTHVTPHSLCRSFAPEQAATRVHATTPAYRQHGRGRSPRRTPSATARIAAAAASSRARRRRPPSTPFASFSLPAGSATVRASARAARSNRERPGATLPSRQVRRNSLTSSAPSLNRMPRTLFVGQRFDAGKFGHFLPFFALAFAEFAETLLGFGHGAAFR